MYCVKCGEKFADNLKYCPNCSTRVGDKISENEILGQTPEEAKRKRNSFLFKWPIIAECIFVLGTLFAFFGGRIISGLIGLGSVGLGFVVILIRMGIIKTNRRWLAVLLLGIAFTLIIFYLRFFVVDYTAFERYDLDEIKMVEMLPTPPTRYGEIVTNEENQLTLVLRHVTEEDFDEYVNTCKEKGFDAKCFGGTEDSEIFGRYTFVGYSEDGYMVSITFRSWTQYEEIEIKLREGDYRELPELKEINGIYYPDLE